MDKEHLKSEKLEHKFKDSISMSKDIYFGEMYILRRKANLIAYFGCNFVCILYFFLISIMYFNLIVTLLCVLVSLLFLLYTSIINDIIIPDKLKVIYKKGYYLQGYIQHSPSAYERIENIIFEPDNIESYRKRKLEEFEQEKKQITKGSE